VRTASRGSRRGIALIGVALADLDGSGAVQRAVLLHRRPGTQMPMLPA